MSYWYPRYPKDFDRGTLGWSLAERGAYSGLIDYYMESGEALPAEPQQLAALLRVDLETWQVISGKVLGKFREADGRLYHERCELELAEQRRRARRSQENGKKGGRPKAKEIQGDKPTRLALAPPPQTQEKPQDSTGQNNTASSLRSEADAGLPAFALEAQDADDRQATKAKRGTRLASDAPLQEDWRLWAMAEGHPDPQAEWERFRDYWSAVPGKDGVKLDWLATWRNRVRDRISNGRCAVGSKAAAAAPGAAVPLDASMEPYRARLEGQFAPEVLRSWFAQVKLLNGGATATLTAPNKFSADYIQREFDTRLRAVFGDGLRINHQQQGAPA